MSVSCDCDYDSGIMSVGHREVTCRTSRKCDACRGDIKVLERMYMFSMFDCDEIRAVRPLFLCEECGDMAENLAALGFCFSLGEGIRMQYLDYLHDVELQ